MKNLCFSWRLLFQKQIADIWNFWWIKYLVKGLSYLKKWGVKVNLCWNYGPSKLLLHFIEYGLDQLNSKHTKIAVNSTIQYFEGCSRKKCLLKVWRFSVQPTKWRPCKFFTKLIRNHLLIANIFKLNEYQTFGFCNNIFSLLRWNKKYFSWFFKRFQLPEIVSDMKLPL